MSINSVYEQYFGLEEQPFSITPDPRFVYLSESHRAALEHLKQGAVGGANGFVLLTGDVGTGKTTICRTFLEHVPPKTEVALILNPVLTLNEFLQTICEELDLTITGNRESNKNLIDHLNRFLLQVYAVGQKTILIVDEAQNLSHELLEQIRLLTNLETNTDKLMQIFLIGQPELRDMLERPDLLQVSQRITSRYHLGPLNKEETRAYIMKRLEVAGTRSIEFSGSAIRRIYAYTKGVPRLINVLCDKALLSAYERSTDKINDRIIKDAEDRIRGNFEHEGGGWFRVAAGFGAIALLSAAVLGAAYSLNIANLQPWVDERLAAVFEDDSVVASVPDGMSLARTEPALPTPTPAQSPTENMQPPPVAAAPSNVADITAAKPAPQPAVAKAVESAQTVAQTAITPPSVEPDSAVTVADPQPPADTATDTIAGIDDRMDEAPPAAITDDATAAAAEAVREPAVALTETDGPATPVSAAGTASPPVAESRQSALEQVADTQTSGITETAPVDTVDMDREQLARQARSAALDDEPRSVLKQTSDALPEPPAAAIEPRQDEPAAPSAPAGDTGLATDDLSATAESELLARIERMESLQDATRSDLRALDETAETAAGNPQRAVSAAQQPAVTARTEPAPRFAIAEPEASEPAATARASTGGSPAATASAAPVASPAKPEQVAKAEPAKEVETAPAPAAQPSPATRPAVAAPRAAPRPRANRPVQTLTDYTQKAAERKLLSMWGVDKEPPAGVGFCQFAQRNGLNCLNEERGLPFLYVYNRPAMISMKIDDVYSYAVVTRASPDNIVVDVLGREHAIPSSVLPNIWDGRSLILWRGSEEFNGELVQGDRGRPVESLRQLIDKIEGTNTTGNVYDAELVARVKKFQSDAGLKPDGIFGPRTHMVMQNKLAQLEKK
ncbi:MAG: AAA family ATPase [Gammaproteobacteria bacterium]|nr:AAA family ATPase [Gammaproteobacteria bacterium]